MSSKISEVFYVGGAYQRDLSHRDLQCKWLGYFLYHQHLPVVNPENPRCIIFFQNWAQNCSKYFYVFLCIFLCYAKQVTLIVKISSLKWWIPNSIFWKRKNTLKGSYTFLNTLIWANILIRKVLKRSFIMLNTIMENKSKSFTNISIFSWGCSFSL